MVHMHNVVVSSGWKLHVPSTTCIYLQQRLQSCCFTMLRVGVLLRTRHRLKHPTCWLGIYTIIKQCLIAAGETAGKGSSPASVAAARGYTRGGEGEGGDASVTLAGPDAVCVRALFPPVASCEKATRRSSTGEGRREGGRERVVFTRLQKSLWFTLIISPGFPRLGVSYMG